MLRCALHDEISNVKKMKITLFWHRRDLRFQDNAGLAAALQSGHPVLPLFIYDQDGDLVATVLQPGKPQGVGGAVAVLRRVVKRLQMIKSLAVRQRSIGLDLE